MNWPEEDICRRTQYPDGYFDLIVTKHGFEHFYHPFDAAQEITRLLESWLDGPADVVIEITSPDSLLRDRGEKFAEYELGGVREYWLIDPERERVDFYRLDAEGYYERAPVDAEGVYHSEVIPGFWLKVEWLWQEPLPKVLDVLREAESNQFLVPLGPCEVYKILKSCL